MKNTLISTFCLVDDFIKIYDKHLDKASLQNDLQKRRKPNISQSEIMTILLCFHTSRIRDFRNYYAIIKLHYKHYFPNICSYNRFLELIKTVALPMLMFFKSTKELCDGTSFIDATTIRVCKNKRIFSHKVFKGLAKRGKSSMGWFYGFKLHIVINSTGGIMNFFISPGNIDDRIPALDLCKGLTGKVYGDRGYISTKLFKDFMKKGLKFFTALRSNMKPKIATLEDTKNLSKRTLVETVFNMLKNSCQIEHSRHRNPANAMVHLFSGIISHNLRRLVSTLLPATV